MFYPMIFDDLCYLYKEDVCKVGMMIIEEKKKEKRRKKKKYKIFYKNYLKHEKGVSGK